MLKPDRSLHADDTVQIDEIVNGVPAWTPIFHLEMMSRTITREACCIAAFEQKSTLELRLTTSMASGCKQYISYRMIISKDGSNYESRRREWSSYLSILPEHLWVTWD